MAQIDNVVANSRASIKKGSKSFSAAARLFDPEMRRHASMLYAWCRHCDDVIDDQHLGFAAPEATPDAMIESQQARLAQLRAQTADAVAGRSTDDPAFEALQRVVSRHAIPARYPLELIDGFAMDVAERRYETLDDVLEYCYHVAGVVGVMMSMVMGVREPSTLVRAADLGIAFQLTNISRDVMEDAANDRLYLPGTWLDAAGIPRDAVDAPAHRPAVAAVVQRLLAVAETYYGSAQVGLRDLPYRAAWAIAAAHGVYRDIGKGVRKRGPRAWDQRVSTGKRRKVFWMVAGATIAGKARTVERIASKPVRPDLWMKSDLDL